MLERWGVIAGSLDPLRVSIESSLPERFTDPEQVKSKLERDQQKLLGIVEYARFEGDRKEFLHSYFGLQLADG